MNHLGDYDVDHERALIRAVARALISKDGRVHVHEALHALLAVLCVTVVKALPATAPLTTTDEELRQITSALRIRLHGCITAAAHEIACPRGPT